MAKYIDAEKLIATLERQNVDKKVIEPLIRIIDSLQQEQPSLSSNLDEAADFLYPFITTVEMPAEHSAYYNLLQDTKRDCFKAGAEWMARQMKQEQPEVELEEASRNVYESWMGGTMDDVRRDMVELGKILNARKEE